MVHEADDDDAACIHRHRGAHNSDLVADMVLLDQVLVDGVDEAQQQDDLNDQEEAG